ncbi:ribonuclease R, partial [Bacillus anthracis]|nr:ribonuclease R [Bacillus anthracis]
MREEEYKPQTIQEFEEAFGIERSERFKDFVKALVSLEDKVLDIRLRSNRYGLPEKMNSVRGKLIGHARGFAFVVPDDKKTGDDDLFIPPTELNGALHGDTVLARLSSQSSGSRQDASIVRLLERSTK